MKILIAIEDEVFGDAIAEFIAAHEWPEQSEFKLIHVMEPVHVNVLSGYPSELMHSFNEERQRAAKSLLLRIGTKLSTAFPRTSIKEEIVDGNPKTVIVNMARDWPADLIVMGSHGRTGIGQFLLGSVSLSVLSAAPCSLIVVKMPQEAKHSGKESSGNKEAVESKV